MSQIVQDHPLEPVASPDPATEGHDHRLTQLWIAGYLVVVAGLLLLWQFPFPGHATALVDLWKISDGSTTGFVVFIVAQALMTAGWLWAVWLTRDRSFRDCWLPVVGITIILSVTFLLVYPATAIDVYIYAARSHLFSEYGLNPSTAVPREFWDVDPYVHYASWEWSDDPSPYGPLWNVAAAPLTAFGGSDIRIAVLLFKGMMLAATAGTAALVYTIARRIRPGYALAAMLAWLWCPVVLWEGIANSHNDVLLMLLVIAALWCWQRRHDGWVIPLIGAASLLKVVTVMLIPAAIVAIIVRAGWSRRLAIIAGQTAVLSIAVLWIAFVPYYDVQGTIDAIRSQRDVWVTSPVLLFDAMNMAWGWGLDPAQWFNTFSTAVIIVLTATGALVARMRPELLPRIAFEQLFWFLLLATANLRPWYLIWLVALAVVLPLGMPLLRAIAWSIGALFSYGYTSWIGNWTDPTWLERNAITMAITLLPVLLVTGWSAWRTMRIRYRRAPAGVPSRAPGPEAPFRG